MLMRLHLHHHYIITINAISSLLDPHPTINIRLSLLNCYLPATSILLLPLQHHCSIISLQSLLLNHHYALCSHIHIFSSSCDPYPYIPIFSCSHILIFYIIAIALPLHCHNKYCTITAQSLPFISIPLSPLHHHHPIVTILLTFLNHHYSTASFT
jgi:hypothetical protein